MSQLVWLDGTQTAQCASELKQLPNKIFYLTSPFNFAKKKEMCKGQLVGGGRK